MLETELEKKTGPDPPGGRPGSGSGIRKAKPLVRASSMDRPSGLSEGKERTFRNLEKKNKQLNSATKQLEEPLRESRRAGMQAAREVRGRGLGDPPGHWALCRGGRAAN